jgi:hypothetical protein
MTKTHPLNNLHGLDTPSPLHADDDASPCSGGGHRARKVDCVGRPFVDVHPLAPVGHLHTAMRSTQEHRISVVSAWRELAQLRNRPLTCHGSGGLIRRIAHCSSRSSGGGIHCSGVDSTLFELHVGVVSSRHRCCMRQGGGERRNGSELDSDGLTQQSDAAVSRQPII